MNDKKKYPADELLALIHILENKGLDALEKLELLYVLHERGNSVKVQPGQVWQDNDKRNNFPNGYRTIKIKEVDSRYAYGIVEQSSKPTRILLNRFNPNCKTGYTLIKESQE